MTNTGKKSFFNSISGTVSTFFESLFTLFFFFKYVNFKDFYESLEVFFSEQHEHLVGDHAMTFQESSWHQGERGHMVSVWMLGGGAHKHT